MSILKKKGKRISGNLLIKRATNEVGILSWGIEGILETAG